MKHFLVAFFIFLVPSFSTFGQKDTLEPRPSFMDRLIFGGGLGLQFGTLTLIDVSPVIGYRLTSKLEIGIGGTYKYYKYNDFYYDQTTGDRFDLKSNIFGGSVYSRYHFLKNFFAHVEYERLRYNFDDIYYSGGFMVREPTHAYVNSFFVGGGLRQQISSSAYLFIMALWNLTEDEMSPYSNPIMRMGVLLGR